MKQYKGILFNHTTGDDLKFKIYAKSKKEAISKVNNFIYKENGHHITIDKLKFVRSS